MHRMMLEFPNQIETDRLVLRSYRAGDGPWYYAMSQKNRQHLMRFERENAIMTITNEEEAEIVVRDFAAAWVGRQCFFLGAFEKTSQEFVAQIYVGPVSWNRSEFEIGYFVDVDHEGRGYVTEAVRAVVKFLFEYLEAHRIRLECDDANLRSAAVANRCGFVEEAHFRQNKLNPDGTFSGTLCYGLLKSDLSK
jgi:ribosomal-protein-alanine N-acetyltransferase